MVSLDTFSLANTLLNLIGILNRSLSRILFSPDVRYVLFFYLNIDAKFILKIA